MRKIETIDDAIEAWKELVLTSWDFSHLEKKEEKKDEE